jgi:hypothetical protein
MPADLRNGCYEINLNWVEILPSHDGDSVLLSMTGSDGAYGYQVYWTIVQYKFLERYVYALDDQWLPKSVQTNCTNFE